jgi:hypothetical protein
MKTYSERKKKPPFDWNKFLDRAINDQITDKEYDKACDLSADWVTCACGNQCEILPRDEDGEPLDGELYSFGLTFNKEIEEQKYKDAKKTLDRIEKRSTKLIKKHIEDAKSVLEKMGYKVS